MYKVLSQMAKRYERVVCADNFSMSVQAGVTHYCYPRDGEGPYKEVEVGFPSQREELLMDYAEREDDPTKTVYGYVPSSVVTLVIAKHGGIVSGDLPPGVPALRAEAQT